MGEEPTDNLLAATSAGPTLPHNLERRRSSEM